MKFKYIGPNYIAHLYDQDGNAMKTEEMPVGTYGGKKVKNGDVVEFDGFFAEKALSNPDYEQIKPGPKKPKVDVSRLTTVSS